MSDERPDWERLFGIAEQKHHAQRDHQHALVRWVMASLIVLNGGAAIASLQFWSASEIWWPPFACWAIGCILAVVAGILTADRISLENRIYLADVAHGSDGTEKFGEAEMMSKALRRERLARSLQYVSLATFALGGILTGATTELRAMSEAGQANDEYSVQVDTVNPAPAPHAGRAG